MTNETSQILTKTIAPKCQKEETSSPLNYNDAVEMTMTTLTVVRLFFCKKKVKNKRRKREERSHDKCRGVGSRYAFVQFGDGSG